MGASISSKKFWARIPGWKPFTCGDHFLNCGNLGEASFTHHRKRPCQFKNVTVWCLAPKTWPVDPLHYSNTTFYTILLTFWSTYPPPPPPPWCSCEIRAFRRYIQVQDLSLYCLQLQISVHTQGKWLVSRVWRQNAKSSSHLGTCDLACDPHEWRPGIPRASGGLGTSSYFGCHTEMHMKYSSTKELNACFLLWENEWSVHVVSHSPPSSIGALWRDSSDDGLAIYRTDLVVTFVGDYERVAELNSREGRGILWAHTLNFW